MLDMSRVYRLVLLDKRKKIKKVNISQPLLYSLEYHLNEIEKVKYNGIKKYLPNIGFEMVLDQDNVLKINAIPEGLNETKTIVFIEKLLEVLDYKTEEEFITHYEEEWVKIQSKSKFDFLYKKDVEEIIKDFQVLGFPEYLPDGKKCYIALPLDELKNKF